MVYRNYSARYYTGATTIDCIRKQPLVIGSQKQNCMQVVATADFP